MISKRLWLLPFLGTMLTAPANSQVVPSLSRVANAAVYATPTFEQPQLGDVEARVRGFAIGGYLQFPLHLGIDARVDAFQHVNTYHQFSVAIGPRVSFRLSRLGPYGALDVGSERHSGRYGVGNAQPAIVDDHSRNLQWCALAGADLRLRRHLALRLAEVSYSNTTEAGKTIRAFTYGAGVVVSIR